MASVPSTPKPAKRHNRTAWRTRWYDQSGKLQCKWLGYCDEMNQRQARLAFNSWLAGYHTDDRVRNPTATQYTYRVDELARDYLAWAEKTFIKNGQPTNHVLEIYYAMNDLLAAFGRRALSGLTSPDVAGLRDEMLFSRSKDGTSKARTVRTPNGRLQIIKAAMRWARERGMVSAEAVLDVCSVRPLREGRTPGAKASEAVRPIDEHFVTLTCDHLPAVVKAMVELQWYSGMRPGEVVSMRPCEIDTSGAVWIYRPGHHKTEHFGKDRAVTLGSECQRILKPYMKRPIDELMFSPRDAQQQRMKTRREQRKTKPWPSHVARYRLWRPERFGEGYDVNTYRKAIWYACDAADRAEHEKDQEAAADQRIVPRWSPNRLRHSWATRVRGVFGLEAASVGLGHASIDTTLIYAERSMQTAIEVARKLG